MHQVLTLPEAIEACIAAVKNGQTDASDLLSKYGDSLAPLVLAAGGNPGPLFMFDGTSQCEEEVLVALRLAKAQDAMRRRKLHDFADDLFFDGYRVTRERKPVRAKGGRPPKNDDASRFAQSLRRREPPMTWDDIAVEWNALHPDEPRDVDALRKGVERYEKRTK